VGFSGHASRKKAGNAAHNYSVLLKMTLNLLKMKNRKNREFRAKDLKLLGTKVIC